MEITDSVSKKFNEAKIFVTMPLKKALKIKIYKIVENVDNNNFLIYDIAYNFGFLFNKLTSEQKCKNYYTNLFLFHLIHAYIGKFYY